VEDPPFEEDEEEGTRRSHAATTDILLGPSKRAFQSKRKPKRWAAGQRESRLQLPRQPGRSHGVPTTRTREETVKDPSANSDSTANGFKRPTSALTVG
jgi:hypothetical protein